MILIYGKGRVGKALVDFCGYNNIPFENKDDNDEINDFSKYSHIIPSPGIPPTNKIYKSSKIIGELDFIHEYLPKNFKIISVTGTDGKSTISWILYSLFKQEYGENTVFLSGNFSIPFSETVLDIQKKGLKKGYIVLEISSFMAYNIDKFTTDYSIFSNFENDHLNWHSSSKCYFDSKMKIIKNTRIKSVIFNKVFDKISNSLENNIHNYRIYGETDNKDIKDRVEMPHVIISGRKKYNIGETNFNGNFNALNILAATIITNELKICSKRTKKYLENIKGLPHRQELIRKYLGRKFIEDSKSTSSQSLKAALNSFDNVILIAGGTDKGDKFEELEQKIKENVKFGVLIGKTKDSIAKKFIKAKVDYVFAESMENAVDISWKNSSKGDTILLSPGCASFGMFKDYLDRANKFREAVNSIK